jgi:two-component system chemotaxis response regulator CheB
MPREAIAVGAVDEVVPIQDMAQKVLQRLISSGGMGNRV